MASPAESPASNLGANLRAELERVCDPKNAGPMQAYMKSAMPFLGVHAPELRAVCKRVYGTIHLSSASEWQSACLAIWRGAEYREERHAAIELTGHPLYRAYQTLDTLPMYEEMIVTGAWWDFVDVIAKERIGELLRRYPKPMRRKMLAWSKSTDRGPASMWKRRAAILCQLGFKKETDVELIYECIKPSLGSKEFFLQKAIGWALRQYAWVNPKEVKRYVKKHEAELSALSKREALKNI